MIIFDNILIFRYVRYQKFNNFNIFHIFNNFDIFNIFDCGGQTSKRAGGQACGRASFKTKSTPKHNQVFQFCSSTTRKKLSVCSLCRPKLGKAWLFKFVRLKLGNKLKTRSFLVFSASKNQEQTKKLSFLIAVRPKLSKN